MTDLPVFVPAADLDKAKAAAATAKAAQEAEFRVEETKANSIAANTQPVFILITPGKDRRPRRLDSKKCGAMTSSQFVAETAHRVKELQQSAAGIHQFSHVGYGLGRLHGEEEVSGRRCRPPLPRGAPVRAVKAGVDLHATQSTRITLKMRRLRTFGRYQKRDRCCFGTVQAAVPTKSVICISVRRRTLSTCPPVPPYTSRTGDFIPVASQPTEATGESAPLHVVFRPGKVVLGGSSGPPSHLTDDARVLGTAFVHRICIDAFFLPCQLTASKTVQGRLQTILLNHSHDC